MVLKDLALASTASLSESQKVALDQFASLGIPTLKHEEWKFTNIGKIANYDWTNTAFNASAESVSDAVAQAVEGNVLVVLNGQFRQDLSKIVSKDLLVLPLSEALKNNSVAQQYYTKIANQTDETFVALNNALHDEGVFIHVAKSKVIEAPVSIVLLSDATTQNVVSYPRVLAVAEENAELSIVTEYKTLGDFKSFVNEVVEISVAKHARVGYYKIQNDNAQASHVGLTQVLHAEESYFYGNTFSFSGELIRNNLNLILNGERIESHMNGLYVLNGNTHVDNHTVADHRFPNCESFELYKGIMNGASNGVFNGKIFVRQDAQKTNAFQSNKNILISADAKVNTKPQLEIWADDVKCSHGCTVGQLDQEALFYLKARGIGEVKAKALLLEAFAGELVERIKIDALKEKVHQILVQATFE